VDDVRVPCGSARFYHPSGVPVTLPLVGSFAEQFAAVGDALAAGFLASPPGVEQGEHKDDIGYVVKREKENDDGTVTPIVDLYPADEALKFAMLSVYLNRPQDEAAFEAVSGVKVASLPLYIGQNKVERGKSRQTDALVVKVPRPFGVVWKDNPKYDPAEQDTAKKKPKRLFVRWFDQKPPQQQSAATGNPPQRTGEPGEAYRSALADLKECSTLSALQYVWEEINAAKGEFSTPELNDLIATKEHRKLELKAAGGRLFAPGEKAGGGMPVH
jgi:hypothetical protein